MSSVELLIVGTGPFGLSMAAQEKAGLDYWMVGKPMDFWRTHVPAGMLLRPACNWHLDPANIHTIHTIDAFLHTRNQTPAAVEPFSRDFYLEDTRWFQEQKGLVNDPHFGPDLGPTDGPGRPTAAISPFAADGYGWTWTVMWIGFSWRKNLVKHSTSAGRAHYH